MMGIAAKLKRSQITKHDPEADELLQTLRSAVTHYTYLSSPMFEGGLGLFNAFIIKFLNTHAYVGKTDGLHLPSFDPYDVAYTEEIIDNEVVKYWIALWTNCFIVYSEFEITSEKDGVLLGIETEFYNKNIKKDRDEPT